MMLSFYMKLRTTFVYIHFIINNSIILIFCILFYYKYILYYLYIFKSITYEMKNIYKFLKSMLSTNIDKGVVNRLYSRC